MPEFDIPPDEGKKGRKCRALRRERQREKGRRTRERKRERKKECDADHLAR